MTIQVNYSKIQKQLKKLPEFLTIDEIDLMVSQIDRSKSDGERNIAILKSFMDVV